MVLVGFGGDWTAIWSLPAMVGVVEFSNFRLKMARKAETPKKSFSAPMVFRTTAGESSALGLKSRAEDHQTALLFGFKMLSSLCSNSYFK